jgi:diguanylate cyclase (GGDEF)-like protein
MEKLRRILVVDGSRVVRATLNKHLKDNFEIREEANGESAWQSLVLDSSIVLVIASAHTPKLEEQGLLQRLRSSSLRRLNELPFVLIASDTDQRIEEAEAKKLGISGFIKKTMRKTEILERLRVVLDPCTNMVCEGLPEVREVKRAALVTPAAKTPKLLSREEIGLRITHALSANPETPAGTDLHSTGVCVLMFGIVNHDALINQFGEEVADDVGTRFASLLLAKIGPHDCIGRYPGERLVIISRGVTLDQCMHFAKRVCKSLASGHITIRGQQIKLSASAGAVIDSEHGMVSGDELLALASQRLDRALGCGGNTVVTDSRPDCPLHNAGKLLPTMLASLGAHDEKTLAAQIGTLGLQVLPLIAMMNKELSLGLQMPEIKKQLQQRAKTENSAELASQSA